MGRQRIDPAEWDANGGAVLGSHAEWSDRACGIAALRMILLAYRGTAPPLTELIKTGVREGASPIGAGCTPGSPAWPPVSGYRLPLKLSLRTTCPPAW